ncbi:MAG: hypothetical protein IKZ90_02000 [Clostridiales bacterium]|nr:hypothetical protein [Clostridiales bacterium]
MTTEQTKKTLGTRQFLAFVLVLAFLASALPSAGFLRSVLAAPPLMETGNKVYHDDQPFELYRNVNGETRIKILEYMYAETTEPGQQRPVYCVMAGAPSPEGGSIKPTVMQDPMAKELLGKLQYIIEMNSSHFKLPDTVNGISHIHYCVKQLLIWHLIYLYQEKMGSEAQTYLKGVDLDSFIDGQGSGQTAISVLAEAKRLWKVYDEAGRPSLTGAYTPNYVAEIKNLTTLAWESAAKKYRATFTVNVRETVKGKTGGTFSFTKINGGKIYLKGSDGTYSQLVSPSSEYPSGSSFRIEGEWKGMVQEENLRSMNIQVRAESNTGNESSQWMYGYFFDGSPSESGKPRQTYVALYESSQKTFAGSSARWQVKQTKVELTKETVFESIRLPEEGATFEIYRSDYTDLASAKTAGFGFDCISDKNGKIKNKATGETLLLPSGKYTIKQTFAPSGTKMMSPNPATFTVDANKTTSTAFFEDVLKNGSIAIEKKIQTGYDIYAGTATSKLASEKGAVFQVWNTKYASYEKAPEVYRDLLETDQNGRAQSKKLPAGEYRIHQIDSEATKYTYACSDENITITGDGTDGKPEKTLTLVDRQYELKIQIRKVDQKTGEIIPVKGVEFSVLNDKMQVLKDWNGKDTFVTKADGTADLDKLGLAVGTYYIKEKKAPSGFVLSKEPIRIEAKKGESFIGVGPKGDLKAVPFADDEVEVTLEFTKNGGKLASATSVETGYDDLKGYRFNYSSVSLSGAVYELYCNEDVLGFSRDISLLDPKKYPEGTILRSTDGKTFRPYKMFDKDGDGVKETPLKSGTLLGTYATDKNGKISIEHLSLNAATSRASYKLVEKTAPDGYLLDPTPVIFSVSDTRSDQTIRIVKSEKSALDWRQKAEITFSKVGRTYEFDPNTKTYISSEKELSGAVFGVYAAEDIHSASGAVIVKKDALIEVVTSDEDGVCRTTSDLPLGYNFYVKELKAPDGYLKDEGTHEISTKKKKKDQTTAKIVFAMEKPIVNEISRARLQIEKIADDTRLPMEGVEFEVYTTSGDLIEKLVTDKNGKAETKTAFPKWETILLRETKTHEHYALEPDKTIRISRSQKELGTYAVQTEKIFNYLLSEICVLKCCNDGSKTPMDGVTFQLWKVEDGGEPDTFISEGKTDAEGKLSFWVGEGDYYLIETDVGRWTNFRVLSEKIPVSYTKESEVYHFELLDDYTEILAEKRSASNGELLGRCGVSIRDSKGEILSFIWLPEKMAYMTCGASDPGATTVLFTNEERNTSWYGTVTILGLAAGDYEIVEVEAPEGYRNDSEVMPVKVKNKGEISVTRLYDTVKTSERDLIIGGGCCGIFGVSGISLFLLAAVDIMKRRGAR